MIADWSSDPLRPGIRLRCRYALETQIHEHDPLVLQLKVLSSHSPTWVTMSNNGPPFDLTAFEGPDDWVSLYLDGDGEDMLTDAEVFPQVCSFLPFSFQTKPLPGCCGSAAV